MKSLLISAIAISATLWTVAANSGDQTNPELIPTPYSNYLQEDFQSYLEETTQWIRENRLYRTENKNLEVAVNSPFEFKPAKPEKGVLLIHGLSDSPYSFIDISGRLYEQGFLVRTVLLPGHGGKPADLMIPTIDNWLELIAHHTALLQQEVDQVWVGGFSTGANLAMIEAMNNPEVDGTLLFSPAFISQKPIDFLAPYAKHFIDWADNDPEVSITRFESLTMNGAALFYESSKMVREQLEQTPYDKPVFLTLSESDSVVDVERVYQYFNENLLNQHNHLTWLGERTFEEDKVSSYSMNLPEQRISSASHMSVLYSPTNQFYGSEGSIRICNNGQSQSKEDACNEGAETWFASFDYTESDRIYARLTWNPYFEESMLDMMGVISSIQ